ncbi:MAG: Flp pilus assembly protein CpaB [Acidimicrobiia bacterium]
MVKRTVVLIVALVLAGVAAFSIWQYLQGVDEDAREGFELRPVLRATQDIPARTPGNTVIDETLYVVSEEQVIYLPGPSPDRTVAFETVEQMNARLRDRFAIGPISRNQILTSDQWEDALEAPVIESLAEIISPGKQAITVQVDATRAVGGFIRPDDRINMIVTIQAPQLTLEGLGDEEVTDENLRDLLDQIAEAQEEEFSRFLLQGIPVLAVAEQKRTGDPAFDNSVGRVQSVVNEDGTVTEAGEGTQFGLLTLEVTAQEAERMVFAFEKGSVWMTLVPDDFIPVATDGINRETLFE